MDIKENQTFYASLSEIPVAFRDTIYPVNGFPEESAKAPVKASKINFTMTLKAVIFSLDECIGRDHRSLDGREMAYL